MVDGYIERRRQYVAQIRSSFDEADQKETPYEKFDVDEMPFSFWKLQLLLSLGIFFVFLFLKFTKSDLYGYQAQDVERVISDNHYYTELQEQGILGDMRVLPMDGAADQEKDTGIIEKKAGDEVE